MPFRTFSDRRSGSGPAVGRREFAATRSARSRDDGSRGSPLAGCCVRSAGRTSSRSTAATAPVRTGEHRLVCPGCGETFRRGARGASAGDEPVARRPPIAAAGRLALALLARCGAAGGRAGLPRRGRRRLGRAAGLRRVRAGPPGLAPRRDQGPGAASSRRSAAVHVVTETRDPDADLGPVLARTDAPLLFAAVDEVSRRLGVKPPGQIRLTYLPCCGVVAWGRSQALILGLPLLARADPGRAPRHPRARAGPPGAGRRDAGGALGPVRRGAEAGARPAGRPGARAARGLGPDLLPRGRRG